MSRLTHDTLPALQRLSLEVGALSVTYALVLLSRGNRRTFYNDLARDLLASVRRQDRSRPSPPSDIDA